MFPFSSFTAVSVISDLPLEVTTCKFRFLDEGEVSRVIKRFLRIRSKHEGFRPSIETPLSRADPSRDPKTNDTSPVEIGIFRPLERLRVIERTINMLAIALIEALCRLKLFSDKLTVGLMLTRRI